MSMLVIRPAAIEDLAEIVAYYETESSRAADLFLTELESAFDHISTHPHMGKLYRTGASQLVGIRIWPIRRFKHLIFYHPMENGVEVVRVLHGMRDIEDLLIENRTH